MEAFSKICRSFAGLLTYPDEELALHADRCAALLAPGHPQAARSLERFCAFLAEHEPACLEEVYTVAFDLQPVCCPYVGYQLCGEGYQRSRFLVKLQEVYRRYGFAPEVELPDHYGEVLRFLAVVPERRVRDELVADGLLPALAKSLDGFAEPNPYGEVLRSLKAFLEQAVPVPADQPGGALEEEIAR